MPIPSGLPLLFYVGTLHSGHSHPVGFLKAGAGAVCFLPGGRQSVRVFRENFPGVPAGGICGPTGLFVPPLGESDFEDVFTVCRRQTAAWDSSGADFLYLSHQNSLADMRAFVLAARGTGLPVIACCNFASDCEGKEKNSFLPALITLQAMGAAAVGFCGLPGNGLLSLAKETLSSASVPLVFTADAQPDWTPSQYAEKIKPFLDTGIRIIGCGQNTTPVHLHAVHELIKRYGPPKIPEEADCNAATTEQEAFFLGDDLEFSEPIRCSSLLGDKLIRLGDEGASVALVFIESVDDAILLGRNCHLAKLPIAVRTDSSTVLEAALRCFQGRLIIDSSSPIEREVLEPLAAKYGAIIY